MLDGEGKAGRPKWKCVGKVKSKGMRPGV